MTGKDSGFIRDNISEETSKIDWAQLLLDDNTDDMIISVSREKIAHQLIKLKQDNQKLQQQMSRQGTFISSNNANQTTSSYAMDSTHYSKMSGASSRRNTAS